jgi:hypothetical protein
VVVLPNPEKGLGADEDMGGNAAEDFASVFPENVVEKGFFGAAADIGGNALDEEVTFSSFFGETVEDVVANGLFGVVFDMGGNAGEDAGAGAFAVDEVNGLFGAVFDIGGNAEEDAGPVVFAVVTAKGLLGAVADIGGNAEEDTVAAAFSVVEVKGLFGADFDIGGKAALAEAEEDTFASFFGAAKLKPVPVPAGTAAVVDPTPNEKPPAAVVVVVDSSFFGAAKLKPVPVAAGAGAGALPPNENPPAPILLDATGAPNENPPAPIPPAAGAALDEVASAALLFPSEPGFGVSQDAQTETEGLLVTIQTPHSHEPSSDFLKTPPQPSDSSASLLSFAASELSATSSPAALSSSVSSSLSPSPNSQSIYHSMKALRVITLSLDASSTLLIFLMVRRCSSSQYVEPNDSNSLGKSVTEICFDPFARASKASSALPFSSAISLSCDEPSSSSSWSTRLQYHRTNALRVMLPCSSFSIESSCLSISSPWKPSPTSSTNASN